MPGRILGTCIICQLVAHLVAEPEGVLMAVKLDVLTVDVLKDKYQVSQ
jgi:hypothetical protein